MIIDESKIVVTILVFYRHNILIDAFGRNSEHQVIIEADD